MRKPTDWCQLIADGTGTLITSSPDSAQEILGPSVRLEDHSPREFAGHAELIKFYDPTGKVFFFPAAQCKTWFVSQSSYLVHYQIQSTDYAFVDRP